ALAQAKGEGAPSEVVPRLLSEAEEIAGARSDNLSLIALDWQDEPHVDLSDSEATRTVPMDAYATRIDGRIRSKIQDAQPLSDEEIDLAIRDIKIAIQKNSQ
ncbi:MAG: hypothetical protein HGA47_14910, partial [Zoogloea sp.]|nr:hypothetical protein [Zoogloea sp.]